MDFYKNYIERLSRKVEARLSEIEATFNFDLGSEFEVAMCVLLEDILPAKFGVCRGFVVTEDGIEAGDDVIIYDKLSYPTLRSNLGLQYAIKDKIPVDAVYAYIECKHSINDENTLKRAITQAKFVKKVISTRPQKINPNYEKNGPIYNGRVRDWPRSRPALKNQPFCAVFSRNFNTELIIPTDVDPLNPDLLVLSNEKIATQSVILGPDGVKGALFYDQNYSAGLRTESANGNAFGLGLVSLLQAIGWIELIPIDWSATLNSAFTENFFSDIKKNS